MEAATRNRNGICFRFTHFLGEVFRFTHFLGEVDYEECDCGGAGHRGRASSGADSSGYDFSDYAVAP
jgi:hypothetical protein